MLYMAAVSAVRHNPDLARKYAEMRERGKPPKVALTAVMQQDGGAGQRAAEAISAVDAQPRRGDPLSRCRRPTAAHRRHRRSHAVMASQCRCRTPRSQPTSTLKARHPRLGEHPRRNTYLTIRILTTHWTRLQGESLARICLYCGRRRGIVSCLVRSLACGLLAVMAGMVTDVPVADETRTAQWAEAAARQAQEAQRRQREARLRWEYERRRSAAHARMPNTLYASTPSSPAQAEFSCPALVDEDTRRLYRGFLEARRGNPRALAASGMASGTTARDSAINVFRARRPGEAGSPSRQSASAPKVDGPSHLIQPSVWMSATYRSKSAAGGSQQVHLFPSASEPLREGIRAGHQPRSRGRRGDDRSRRRQRPRVRQDHPVHGRQRDRAFQLRGSRDRQPRQGAVGEHGFRPRRLAACVLGRPGHRGAVVHPHRRTVF